MTSPMDVKLTEAKAGVETRVVKPRKVAEAVMLKEEREPFRRRDHLQCSDSETWRTTLTPGGCSG